MVTLGTKPPRAAQRRGGGRGSCEVPVITLAANGTLEHFGAAVVVNATQAGAQTITLPSNAVVPIMPGARARFACKGAGGLTIGGNGANIYPGTTGVPAANLVIALNETTDLVWDGTAWTAVGNP